ncbi:bifunctional glutamate N-acetyltransferase/amino-acid acetyltransferase ArgJ [Euzebya sp.]|uniref:bifunctional glutamate N-acetyltransferase/amino-acid acetyltransferase ArgJ n=1 Tax=Euzebya sp. TaxID=1971409 RepID=UPI003511C42D
MAIPFEIAPLDDGVTAPWGFTAAGVTAGLKASGRPDLAIVATDTPVTAAAVLTTNQVKAAPVVVTAEHLAASGGRARAVLLNAGSANACTGLEGLATAREACDLVAHHLGCDAHEVLICSTGVIGVPIDRPAYLAGIPKVVAAAAPEGGADAAEAIMTTDLVAKEAAVHVTDAEGGSATVGGMCKGSGMIAPTMATMLCVVTTDAPLEGEEAAAILRRATDRTFNRISVDGVMSTNDTIVLLASGTAVTPPDADAVEAGITAVLGDLATQVVRDGEGAQRLVRITVRGALAEDDALAVARQVGTDDLVKTAVAGGDPNWGRIIAAVGASPVLIDPGSVDIAVGDVTVCTGGMAAPFDRAAAEAVMAADEVQVTIDLGLGDAEATFLTCDLTHGYITINAEYTT